MPQNQHPERRNLKRSEFIPQSSLHIEVILAIAVLRRTIMKHNRNGISQ